MSNIEDIIHKSRENRPQWKLNRNRDKDTFFRPGPTLVSNQSRLIVKTETSVRSTNAPPLYHLPLLRSNEFAASAVYCKLSRGPPAARNPPPPPAIPGMHVRGLAAVKRGAVIAVLSAIGPSDISNRAPGS